MYQYIEISTFSSRFRCMLSPRYIGLYLLKGFNCEILKAITHRTDRFDTGSQITGSVTR